MLAFAARRFGDEAARALVATAVIGIYAGDAAELSAPSALPRLAALERAHGSVVRGAIKQRRKGGGFGKPVSFPDGLQELARALEDKLGDRRIVAAAERIERQGDGWRVSLAARRRAGRRGRRGRRDRRRGGGGAARSARARGRRGAAPGAPGAGRRGLPGIQASADIGIDLRSYGFLVARDPAVGGAPSTVLGCQYESSIFAGRAPAGGGPAARHPGRHVRPRHRRGERRRDSRRARSPICGGSPGLTREPDFVRIWRHRDAIPQYALGHAGLVAAADADLARHPGLHLIGHTLRGVGLNDCIAAAAALAQKFA